MTNQLNEETLQKLQSLRDRLPDKVEWQGEGLKIIKKRRKKRQKQNGVDVPKKTETVVQPQKQATGTAKSISYWLQEALMLSSHLEGELNTDWNKFLLVLANYGYQVGRLDNSLCIKEQWLKGHNFEQCQEKILRCTKCDYRVYLP